MSEEQRGFGIFDDEQGRRQDDYSHPGMDPGKGEGPKITHIEQTAQAVTHLGVETPEQSQQAA